MQFTGLYLVPMLLISATSASSLRVKRQSFPDFGSFGVNWQDLLNQAQDLTNQAQVLAQQTLDNAGDFNLPDDLAGDWQNMMSQMTSDPSFQEILQQMGDVDVEELQRAALELQNDTEFQQALQEVDTNDPNYLQAVQQLTMTKLQEKFQEKLGISDGDSAAANNQDSSQSFGTGVDNASAAGVASLAGLLVMLFIQMVILA